MIHTILWVAIIVAAAFSQKLIIEKRSPNHLFWFALRALVFTGFTYWFYIDGYYIVWAMPFMVFSFGFWFPFILNELRGKYVGYMSNRGYDKIMKKIFFGQESLVFFFLLIFMIMTGALHIGYNLIEPTSFMDLW